MLEVEWRNCRQSFIDRFVAIGERERERGVLMDQSKAREKSSFSRCNICKCRVKTRRSLACFLSVARYLSREGTPRPGITNRDGGA